MVVGELFGPDDAPLEDHDVAGGVPEHCDPADSLDAVEERPAEERVGVEPRLVAGEPGLLVAAAPSAVNEGSVIDPELETGVLFSSSRMFCDSTPQSTPPFSPTAAYWKPLTFGPGWSQVTGFRTSRVEPKPVLDTLVELDGRPRLGKRPGLDQGQAAFEN